MSLLDKLAFNKLWQSSALFLLVVIIGCTTESRPVEPVEGIDYAFSAIANEQLERFELTINSKSHKLMCVPFENWPVNTGDLHYAAEVVFMNVQDSRYPIRDRNLGYCPSGCGSNEIPPGGTLRSVIPYSNFVGYEKVSNAKSRTLTFPVRISFC
ncbi:MAG: hypothetical protein DHS20C05_19880 [Hyphococcus sp.]|nr:MAG: hypothetical protein DHS20C05_19880 [Marinicaulis sp.]